MKKSNGSQKLITVIILAAVSFILLLAFSWSTSPFFRFPGNDSAVFKLLGQWMAKGLVPYRDFFDHKGPIIPLVEYIGYGLTGTKWGLLVLQTIALTISGLAFYCTAKLFFKQMRSIFMAIAGLLLCIIYLSLDGGNISEEWVLPFLAWSFYLFVRNIISEKNSYGSSLLIGITFAVCAFTRLTNAVGLVIMIAFGIGYMISKKQWKELLKKALIFIVGVCVITIPIIVWFVINGALGEMLYTTFIYNVKYAAHNASGLDMTHILLNVARFLGPVVVAIIMSIILMVRKKKVRKDGKQFFISTFLCVALVVSALQHLKSAMYSHYLYVTIPLIVVTVIMFINEMGSSKKRWAMRIIMTIMDLLILVNLIGIGIQTYQTHQDSRSGQFRRAKFYVSPEVAQDIKNHIPKTSRDNFVAYNIDSTFYLGSGLTSCYKNFNKQDFQCQYDSSMENGFVKDLESKKAEYILVRPIVSRFNPLIRKNYKKCYQNGNLILLKKR